MRKKILIIKHNDLWDVYKSILEREGYITKILDNDISVQEIEQNCLEKTIQDIVDFEPQLVLCHLSDCICSIEVIEFLARVREVFDENKYPLNLILLARDAFPAKQYQFLMDGHLPDPSPSKIFLETVNKLLASKKY